MLRLTYGPKLWWDTPGFLQANITDVRSTGDNNYSIAYHLDDGYDSSFLVYASTGQINADNTDPTTARRQAGPGWSTRSSLLSPVSGHPKIFTFVTTNSFFAPKPDHKFLARGSFIVCNEVSNSNTITINDFTLLNCAGFGFFSTSNSKTAFNSLSLHPAAFPPPNGTALPALSSSAYVIHSAEDIIRPTIDSSHFAALDDDCVHSTPSPAPANSFLSPKGDAAPGDILRLYADGTYAPLGTATIRSVAPPSSASIAITVDHHSPRRPFSAQHRLLDEPSALLFHKPPARWAIAGAALSPKPRTGLSSTTSSKLSRTVRLDLGLEFSSWNKADFVHDVSITNNTVRDYNDLSKAGAAMMVHGAGNNSMAGDSNIMIRSLVVDNTTASSLYIGAAEG